MVVASGGISVTGEDAMVGLDLGDDDLVVDMVGTILAAVKQMIGVLLAP